MTMAKALLTLGLCIFAITAHAQELRDGKLYDPGITMAVPAKKAPPELAKAAFLIGQWDVNAKLQKPDGTVESSGKAAITFMNRGHAIMLRMVIPGLHAEDSESHIIAFLSYQTPQKSWLFSMYDSYREAIRLYNGVLEGDAIVLRTSERSYGSTLSFDHQLTINSDGQGDAELAFEAMNNRDREFSPTFTFNLKKREASADFMPVRDDFGVASPDRVSEAAQFDFLVGEYNAHQIFPKPDGTKNEFDSTATAVFVCNGTAILEFLWYDVDPSMPDAGISVLRVYNRSMRRWESLFMSNRGNGQLHFGGVKEGDRIILHPFWTDATRPISMWIFHGMRDGAYDWFGQTSNDRGKTWNKTWIINVSKRP